MATFFSDLIGNAVFARVIGATEMAISAVRDGVLKVAVAVLNAQARFRQRHSLSSLDDRMLQDIGLTRSDVARETAKRIWEA